MNFQMDKKIGILLNLLLIFPGKKLLTGTGSASDGLLSFIVLLGFLPLVLSTTPPAFQHQAIDCIAGNLHLQREG